MPSWNKSGFSTAFLSLLLSAQALATDEGITVHGDWEITVLDQEGHVVQKKAFKNALASTGKNALVLLLTGTSVVGERDSGLGPAWRITADDFPADDIDDNTLGCNRLVGPFGFDEFGENQSATLLPVESGVGSFTLQRTITVPAECLLGDSYSISRVSTGVGLESTADQSRTGRGFSSKDLASPVTGILPDQQVVLRVTFSFE